MFFKKHFVCNFSSRTLSAFLYFIQLQLIKVKIAYVDTKDTIVDKKAGWPLDF